nr:tripartite tricarboxylate transporter substrate binding protein [uncultured Cupriavidus sp.]
MAIPTAWRRMFAATFTLVAIGTASTHVAHAQTSYPSRPVTMVVPYPAGGANDMFGRLLGQKMGESLHTSFIVENRPGAGALIGASFVARAPADGYTLLLGGLATHAASPNLLKADYDPLKAFEPIGMIGRAPIVVITSNDSPYKSLKEVVEAARKNPESIMYGSSGNGSPLHLAGEQFLAIAKVKMTHVPYKGGNAHILDLLGGRIPVIFDTATNAMPLIKGGKVRALAVGTPNRLPELPNVPTIAEEGYPQFQFSAWYALFAPANTPKEITARLTEALGKALKDPTVVKKFGDLGVTVANPDPQELAKFLPGEYERIGSLIKTAKIKAD